MENLAREDDDRGAGGENSEPLVCIKCKAKFSFLSNLLRHQKICGNEKQTVEFKCCLCDMSYNRKDNLKRHMLQEHEGEEIDARNDRNYKCPLCAKSYTQRKHLQRHFKCHTNDENLSLSQEQEKCNVCNETFTERAALLSHHANHHQERICLQGKTQDQPEFSQQCDKCKHVSNSTQSFAQHHLKCVLGPKSLVQKQSVNDDEEQRKRVLKKGECLYPGCSEIFFHRTRMLEHLEKDHMQDIQSSMYTLKSFDDFIKWKHEIESDSYTSFTAPCGKTESEKHTFFYYTCQLELSDKSHRKTGELPRKTSRVWKEKGCIPKDMCCPARMLVKKDNHSGEVVVNFIETHSHDINYENCKFKRIPKPTQDFIYACLSAKMTVHAIKEILQGDAGDLDKRNGEVKPKQEHFITVAYIRRLQYRLKTNSKLHRNDSSATSLLVEYLMKKGTFQLEGNDELFSPITVYKPQGAPVTYGDKSINQLENSKDLFLLGFQSREQLRMLQEGAKSVVCIDFTYKITQYDFYLCNIIVPDEYGKGYPVAHFITNRQDKHTLAAALNSIKVRCPDLAINFLMTDDDQSEWQAMEMVFGCGIRRGICKYHLFTAWQRRLKRTDGKGILDVKLRREVYHSLTVLCHERSETSFKKMMEAFIIKYRPLCPVFIKYFEDEYACRPSVWALCYRNFPHGHTDTNMYCESFHNKIKTFYLERKQNRRVDDLLNILVTAERDRYLEHLKMKLEKRVKCDVPISLQRRHSRGIAIPDDDVTCHSTEKFWVVKSQSTNMEEYFITLNMPTCNLDHCYERCPELQCCGLCVHLYTCTCADGNTICKHIHKVHSLSVRLREFKCENHHSTEVLTLHNPTNPAAANEVPESNSNEIIVSEMEKLRTKVVSYFQDLVSKLESTPNYAMLKFFEQQGKLLSSHTNAFAQNNHAEELEKLVATLPVSGPQKVVAYKDLGKTKFYRTTKKFQPSTENLLTKPTFEERDARKRSLLDTAETEIAKRARNMGPAEDECLSINCEASAPSCSTTVKPKSLSLVKQSDSRSFTPKIGFTNNITQPVLFFNGQDEQLSSVTFRALKSLDPYLSSKECKNLNIIGITGSLSSTFRLGWLFDEVINAYFHSVCKTSENLHYFNTLFSDALNRGGALVRNSLCFDKEKVEKIFIPVNITNFHWCLFVCLPKCKMIEFYDPAGPTCSSLYVLFHEKLCQVMNSVYNTNSDWKLMTPPHATQSDTINCGVFICYYAYRISKNMNVKEPMKDTSNFRKTIYQSIAGNCLKNHSYSANICMYCGLAVKASTAITCSNCHQTLHVSCLTKKHQTLDVEAHQEFCCP